MTRLRLAAHAYACRCSNSTIFLNVDADTYSAVPPEDAELLSLLIDGWESTPRTCPLALSDRLTTLEYELRNAGLIAEQWETGKRYVPLQLSRPLDALLPARDARGRIPLSEVAMFARAWLGVAYMLRRWPLRRTFERFMLRSEHQTWEYAEFQKTGRLLTTYARLQPHAFSPVDACLKNSLTLLEYLSHYGLRPMCVFGVTLEPKWAAHAWLQQQHIVLNDYVEHVKCYTPIFRI